MSIQMFPTLGTQGNLWNAAAAGAAGKSNGVQTFSRRTLSVFGTSSGATTLTVEVSADGSTWTAGPTIAVAGAGAFYWSADVGADWVRLSTSNAVTLTATLQAK